MIFNCKLIIRLLLEEIVVLYEVATLRQNITDVQQMSPLLSRVLNFSVFTL